MKLDTNMLLGGIFSLLMAVGASLIVQYGEIQALKVQKADNAALSQIKNDVGVQIARNTEAIEGLRRTLDRLVESIDQWRVTDGKEQ